MRTGVRAHSTNVPPRMRTGVRAHSTNVPPRMRTGVRAHSTNVPPRMLTSPLLPLYAIISSPLICNYMYCLIMHIVYWNSYASAVSGWLA
jgi:hypothetical protein